MILLFQISALHETAEIPMQHLPGPERHHDVPNLVQAEPVRLQQEGKDPLHQQETRAANRAGNFRNSIGKRQRPCLQQDLNRSWERSA